MTASIPSLLRPVRKAVVTLHVAIGMTLYPGMGMAGSINRIDSWPGYVRHLPQQVYVASSNAYFTTHEGIQIFDLGDPAHPVSLSFFPLFEYWEYPTDIQYLAANHTLAIGVGVSFGTYTSQVKGIDVSDLQDPQLVWIGSLYHRPNQIYHDGQKVYSSHNMNGVTISVWGAAGYGSRPSPITNATGRVALSETELYVPTPTGFQIFNAVNNAYLGTFNAGAAGNALAVDGLQVMLAAEDGLHIVDVAAAAAPVQIGHLPLPAEQYNPTGIQLTDNHACLIFSETNLFMTVDIGTPESPVVSGTYEFAGSTRSMSVDNDRAYILAADQIYGSSDLQVLSMANPAEIILLDRLYAHGSAGSIAAGTNMLFLADGQNGLCIFDTESSALSIIGRHSGELSALAADSNRIYAGNLSGFSVFDITIPEAPVSVTNLYDPVLYFAVGDEHVYRIGGYGMPELVISDKSDSLNELHHLYWIEGVNQIRAFDMVRDCYALLVDDFEGNMVVIDVQDPALPILTNYYASAPIMGVAGRIDSGGTNALLATTNGVEVLDMSQSPHFSVVGSWDSPEGSIPRWICVDGDRIAVASSDHLWVLDTSQFNSGDPLIAETAISHPVSHMLLNGDRLYVAAGPEGLMMYQIGGDPAAPELHITLSISNQIELDWNAIGTGWQLQQKQDLSISNGWSTLPGSESITATNLEAVLPHQFFRLIQ